MNQLPEDYRPEDSPHFSHWEYKSKFHEFFNYGERKALFDKTIELKKAEDYLEQHGSKAMIAVAEGSPDLEVIEEQGGEKKAINVSQWLLGKERITLQSYYSKSPWVYRCVDIKAKAIAGIEWNIYPKDPDTAEEGETVEPLGADDQFVELLREVNPEDNWNDFIAKISKDLDIFGKAFIWKVRKAVEIDGEMVQPIDGDVLLLKRLNPSTMEVLSDDQVGAYRQSLPNKQIIYEKENILYFRDYDPDNDVGSISPLQSCLASVQIEIEANSHLNDFFRNNAMPAIVMTTPEDVQEPELQRMAGSWRREFKGRGKRGQAAFMSHGFKPSPLGYPLKDLALVEIRTESRKSICSAFGVPATIAGAHEAANFATADIGRKSLYTETIVPRDRYLQGVINAELMSEGDTPRFFRFEHEKVDVLQEDTAVRAEWISLLVERRVIKPEVAAIEMGFTEQDVPEPLPQMPVMGQTGQEGNSNDNRQPQDRDNNKSMLALRKYRRKAVNRCKDGRNPKCDFNTVNVPDGTISAIKAKLDGLTLVDDVHAVFDEFE